MNGGTVRQHNRLSGDSLNIQQVDGKTAMALREHFFGKLVEHLQQLHPKAGSFIPVREVNIDVVCLRFDIQDGFIGDPADLLTVDECQIAVATQLPLPVGNIKTFENLRIGNRLL